MSLQTWKAEFYPKEPKKSFTKKQAIQHSLKKWEGLTKTNLNKHDCNKGFSWVEDGLGDKFRVNGKSCALCVKYYDKDVVDGSECHKCPLYKSLGNNPCDGFGSIYEQWRRKDNPLPMIKALRKLAEEQA